MDQNPREESPRFSVNDLVWGKIKSHPWWPGQIYDPIHASEFAIENQKSDHILVAYFGDKTFAWVQESQLKHFEPHFIEMGNQKGWESFGKATNDALLEYSRQVELGLVCKCLKDEILVGLKNRKVENTGVGEETCSEGVIVSEFLPSMFLDFIRACALFPFDSIDRLELARVIGQLKAFCGLKGNNELCSMCESTEYFMEKDSKIDVELSVKPDIKNMSCKVKEEVEENEKGGGISSVNKGKKKNVRKVSDKSCFEVVPDSSEKDIQVDSSEKDIQVDSSASKKKRGRSPMIREEVNEKKDSSSGVKVCFEVVPDSREKDIKLDSSASKKTRGRPCKIREEVNEKKDFSSGEKVCIVVVPDSSEKDIKVDSSASKKKRGRPRKISEEVNEKEDCSSGEKVCKRKYIRKTSDNEKHTATGSVKLGRRKKVKNDEDVSEKSRRESEELTEEEDSDQEKSKLKVRKKKNLDGDSESGELGRGKRVKHKKEIVSPLSASRAKLGDRIKHAAIKVKASLTSEDKDEVSAKDCSSPSEMLSQLYSVVLDPTNNSDIMPANIKFFTDFKNFISSMSNESKGGRKNKEGNSGPTPFELSEADYVQDSYWSGIVFDGSPKKEAASKEMEDKNVKGCSAKDTKEMEIKNAIGDSVKKTDDETLTELILGFSEPDALPSISDLIGKLSAYGPLKEEDTEVLITKKQAKVVFKHRVDAESAYDDAGNHSIFGATPVSYRLKYSHQPSSAASPNMNNSAQINDGNLENRGISSPSPQQLKYSHQPSSAASPNMNNSAQINDGNLENRGISSPPPQQLKYSHQPSSAASPNMNNSAQINDGNLENRGQNGTGVEIDGS